MNAIFEVARCMVQWRAVACTLLLIVMLVASAPGQDRPAPSAAVEQRIAMLTQTIDRIQAQLQQSQRDLADLRREVADLQSASDPVRSSNQPEPAIALADAVASLRENEAMHQSQIATLQQTKVESASKYPLKISGLVLMTGVVNTRRVDIADTPTLVLSGPGSTAATMRQTILGLDADGPHLFGAKSFADVRLDFDGSDTSGYSMALLRLRTAHAELDWNHTRTFFALDHSFLNPGNPTSLVAVAEPALAWSGNLWSWNPQVGLSQEIVSSSHGTVRMEGALIYIADPPLPYAAQQYGTYAPPSTSELSRWPGIEGRIGFDQGLDQGTRIGISGIFAPHRTEPWAVRFDSWAAAADFAMPAGRFTRFSGDLYTGSALGGLGGGAFKDFASTYTGGEFYLKALDDAGGWVQWQQKPSERLQFNEAVGIDNVPAHQLRPYATASPFSYYNLARNRTITGNVIYSPNASLLFSLEYRRIASSYISAPTQSADVIGVAAGYKF